MQSVWQQMTWAFIHSMWVGVVLYVFVGVFMLVMGSNRPGLRHNFLLAVVVLFVAAFFINIFWQPHTKGLVNNRIIITHTQDATILLAKEVLKDGNWSTNLVVALSNALPWIAISWLVFIVLKVVLLFRSRLTLMQVIKNATAIQGELWQPFANTLHPDLCKRVRVKQSPEIISPFITGFRRPVVLIPATYFNRLSPDKISCVIFHELAHANRRDYVIHSLQSFLSCIFFLNPFYRKISNQLDIEREYCCDDVALRELQDESVYAHTLVTVYEEYYNDTNTIALNFSSQRFPLAERIQRLFVKGNFSFDILQYVLTFVCGVAALSLVLSFTNNPSNYHVKSYSLEAVSKHSLLVSKQKVVAPMLSTRDALLLAENSDSSTVSLTQSVADIRLIHDLCSFLKRMNISPKHHQLKVMLTQNEMIVNGACQPDSLHMIATTKFLSAKITSLEFYGPIPELN